MKSEGEISYEIMPVIVKYPMPVRLGVAYTV